ncbi:PSD1 and planctomycete cytochrome C domain-containing protein [Rhodopirellula sp. JC740]|uniref:PSD1 and planctomycete cytochrome C domain-containing protein n=1 Tax=Rhodopirellula halodulae TaxID=2894198 RepID=A0ABS8NP17_9BACT|nr:PSD1 and planctomycete cytochrome C domain-containing protein [Rhodopirellula sp. JC740]MCC9645325.1 PSD1 and planctomycete cytochrome C domain-containing protein [Rhodopirellula sp. JC740]
MFQLPRWMTLAAPLWCVATTALAVDYSEQIQPLLSEKCAPCHGALKQEADLRLDAGVLIHESGMVDVEAPSSSVLLARVIAEDPHERMPPKGEGEQLTSQQVDLLSRWVAEGAVYPDDETIPDDPANHWAYQPPTKTVASSAKVASDPSHASNESSESKLDELLAKQWTARGIEPAPLADPRTLVRRLYLDVLGLPPTTEEVDRYLADESPDAWRQLVDRLLEHPAYSERWARHWMDVWRYSDWDGYKDALRGSARHIWRWRDWIIQSLAEDKGYDQMIREMIAGDEIAPLDQDVLAATGFLARNFHNSNRDIWLDASVEHTAKAFLGLTLNCARCHDHKYDPIAQTDYYQFRAIYEPHRIRTDLVSGEPSIKKDGLPRAYDSDLDVETYLYLAGNEKTPDKDNPLTAALPSLFRRPLKPVPVSVPREAAFPKLRKEVQDRQVRAAQKKIDAATKAYETAVSSKEVDESHKQIAFERLALAQSQLTALQSRWTAEWAVFHERPGQSELAQAAAAAERLARLAETELQLSETQQKLDLVLDKTFETEEAKTKEVASLEKSRDDARKKRDEAKQALVSSDGDYSKVSERYPTTSSGRRLALAEWIVDPSNPLTARVAVNHVWSHYFGKPIVENTFDFGLRSPRPLQIEVLDHLAVEWMRNGWSWKHLHRMILNSRAYRRASSGHGNAWDVAQKADPDNETFWRAVPRRLEAEAVRDALLHVAGLLREDRGGPETPFADGERVYRRSVYLQHAYEKQNTMLVLFDAANPNDCYRRSESVVPQQALALANSDLALSASRTLARNLQAQLGNPSPKDFIQTAFETVLSRPAREQELDACVEFLHQQTLLHREAGSLTPSPGGTEAAVKASGDPDQRAKESLVHVLLNHNDFVTIR